MNLVRKLKLLLPNVRIEKSKTLSILQVLMAVLFLMGAAVICYVFIRNEWTEAANHVITSGESISTVLAASAKEPINSGNLEEIQGLVFRLNHDKRIGFVRITDVEGNMIARSGRSSLVAELAREDPIDSWETLGTCYKVYKTPKNGDTYYVIENEITSGSTLLGRVEVAFRHPSLSSYIIKGIYRGEIALFGVALLLLVGNYFIHVFVGPMLHLKHKMLEAQAAEAERPWEKLDTDMPVRGEAGEIAAVMDDIMSKLRNEYRTVVGSNRELQVSNRVILFEKRRTESIIDGLGEGIIITDSYGRIALFNREAEALLAVNRKDVLGRTPAEALGGHEQVVQFMTTGRPDATGRRCAELDFSNGEGQKLVKAQASPMMGPAEKNAGMLTMLRDITQQKMEEQARRDFISNVSHELRAPLSAIKSYVEMLIDNEADTPELRAEFFNTINQEADRLARLIDNMLNISKIEVGGLVLNKSSVKMRKLLEDAYASVLATAKSKNIDISSDLPDDLPDAHMDKELIRVVVMNLLGNAIKYTEAGGSVILAGEVDPGELRVHVIDTGWGIPAEEQEKVFDRFYRGKRTGSEKITGNGLGLALAKEIACLHGGDLELESQEGKGSKFTLHLPLK